eukprot:TRINITY_DN30855_c0_g1_i1.p1 TRINITY_DN30855_c0_g1~~TRINITY_DN30855_c0_g1_i1.p1  ORF type:complete len:489 (+),score=94.73 TRINITY_DN30855_c0_g1_i1:53-1468(+)
MGFNGVPYKLMAFPFISLIMIMYFFFSTGTPSEEWKPGEAATKKLQNEEKELEAVKNELANSRKAMDAMRKQIDILEELGKKKPEDTSNHHKEENSERCYYVTGNGVGDRTSMGMYLKHNEDVNDKHVFHRNKGAWTREERWLCSLADGRWILSDSFENCKAGQATWVSKTSSQHPLDIGPWSTLVGDGWTEIPEFNIILKTEVDCSLTSKLEGKIPHTGQSNPTKGVNYEADYDVTDPKKDDEKYAYKPGIGFKYMEDRDVEKPPFTVLSNIPKIYFFDKLLTDEECDAIVHAAESRITRSGVVPWKGSNASNIQEVRTSSHTWLTESVPAVNDVMNRLLSLFGFKVADHEALQVLRYQHNQKYDAHHDYFDPGLYGKQVSNRALTCFLYLNTVEEGGETWFPRANGGAPTGDFRSCNFGLRAKPVKGSAACFYDMRPDLSLDEYSLHGGCPVKQGVKWGGTLWMHVDVE